MIAFRLAMRAVFRNWRHSLACMLSIAFGSLGLCFLQGYMDDVAQQFEVSYVNRTMTGHIILDKVDAQGDEQRWTDEELRVLEQIKSSEGEAIAETVRFLRVEGLIAGSGPSFAFSGLGYDVETGEAVRGPKWAWSALYGQPLKTNQDKSIVVGVGLAEFLGCAMTGLSPVQAKDGSFSRHPAELDCLGQNFLLSTLTASGQMNAADVTLVGMVDAGMRDLEDSWLLMPLPEAQKLLGTNSITMAGLTLKNAEDGVRVLRTLEDRLRREAPALRVMAWDKHPSTEIYRQMMGIMRVLQIFMLIVVFAVALLAMFNSLVRSVDERSAEIGTLQAIGFERGMIRRMFAWEAGLTATLGVGLGFLLTALVSLLAQSIGVLYHAALIAQKVPLRIALTPGFTAALAAGLLLGCAMTADFVLRARLRQPISDTLRRGL